jgi:hypothetical protein
LLQSLSWPAFLISLMFYPVYQIFLKKKKISGSGTGCTQPREYNWGATW